MLNLDTKKVNHQIIKIKLTKMDSGTSVYLNNKFKVEKVENKFKDEALYHLIDINDRRQVPFMSWTTDKILDGLKILSK